MGFFTEEDIINIARRVAGRYNTMQCDKEKYTNPRYIWPSLLEIINDELKNYHAHRVESHLVWTDRGRLEVVNCGEGTDKAGI